MQASHLRLYSRLQITAHRLKKAADKTMLEASGLTTIQIAVLALIQSKGSIRQNEIAHSFSLNESAVTALISKLIRQNIITKTRSAKDARAWQLSITPKGKQAWENAQTPFQDFNAIIEKALDEQGCNDLARLLSQLDKYFS